MMLYLPTLNWDFAGYYVRDETLLRDNYEIKLYRCAKETVYYNKRQSDTIYTVNQVLHWYTTYFFTQSLIAADKVSHVKWINLVHVLILNAWIKCQTNL